MKSFLVIYRTSCTLRHFLLGVKVKEIFFICQLSLFFREFNRNERNIIYHSLLVSFVYSLLVYFPSQSNRSPHSLVGLVVRPRSVQPNNFPQCAFYFFCWSLLRVSVDSEKLKEACVVLQVGNSDKTLSHPTTRCSHTISTRLFTIYRQSFLIDFKPACRLPWPCFQWLVPGAPIRLHLKDLSCRLYGYRQDSFKQQ